MVDKRKFKELKEHLKYVIPAKELDQDKSPDEILDLIAKYKKAIVVLKTRGGEEFDSAIRELVSLRIKLSNIFKEKQRKLLDEHWNEIQKKNSEFIKGIQEQLQKARKATGAIVLQFDNETKKIEKLQKDWLMVQAQLTIVNIKIEEQKKEILDSAPVKKLHDQMDRDVEQALGAGFPQQIPRPSFKNCVQRVMDGAVPKSGEELVAALNIQIRQDFAQMVQRTREHALLHKLEEVEEKIARLQHAENRALESLANPKTFVEAFSGLTNLGKLQEQKEKLEATASEIQAKIVKAGSSLGMISDVLAAKDTLSDDDLELEQSREPPTPFPKKLKLDLSG